MSNTRNIIIFIAALSLAIHLMPFLAFGPHPLGYDTGFYRRYLIQPFASFPNTPVPGFGENALLPRVFLDIIRLSRLSPDTVLYGSYIFLFSIQSIALYFLVAHFWGHGAGTLAAILLILSPIQYTAYWFMLFKNAFALPLLLTEFLLLEKGSRFAVLLGILIVFSHHTTSIVFLLTLAIFMVINRKQRALTAVTFAGTALAFFYLHSASLPEYLNAPVAVFTDRKEYFMLALPLLLLALWGVKDFLWNNPRSTIMAFFLVTAAFPILALPFYERIFIFTDIIIVMAAALGFKNLIHSMQNNHRTKNRLTALLLIAVLPIWALLNFNGRIHNLRPLVSSRDIEELQNISQVIPNNAAILTSTPLAPWVQGWSQNNVIAPGLMRDTHTAQEWVSFSHGSRKEKIKFLENFPKPLYFFLTPTEKEKFLENFKECILGKTPYSFQYTCY